MKIGDKVAVVDENVEGIVISIEKNHVIFEDKYGFDHRYSLEDVVVQNNQLYENIVIKEKFEYTKVKSKKVSKKHLVLDLHFNQLVKNTEDYDSFERLFLQKDRLLQTIDFCRDNKIKKLEVIHGIGDGIVQNMVHQTLENQSGIEFYNTAVIKEDSGAVIVLF